MVPKLECKLFMFKVSAPIKLNESFIFVTISINTALGLTDYAANEDAKTTVENNIKNKDGIHEFTKRSMLT